MFGDLIWKAPDDRECGLDGLEDKIGLRRDLANDLGESGGLGEITDCGLEDDEGEGRAFESLWGAGMFLDVCQDVLRKSEFKRGRI